MVILSNLPEPKVFLWNRQAGMSPLQKYPSVNPKDLFGKASLWETYPDMKQQDLLRAEGTKCSFGDSFGDDHCGDIASKYDSKTQDHFLELALEAISKKNFIVIPIPTNAEGIETV